MFVIRVKRQIRWLLMLFIVVAIFFFWLLSRRSWAQTNSATQNESQTTPHPAANVEPLSPEEEKDLADIRAHSPEIAPRLQLPEAGGVWALDKFNHNDELVALRQPGSLADGDTEHYVDAEEVNPNSVEHHLTELRGAAATVQLHTATPQFFIRVGSSAPIDANPRDFRVDTHGSPEMYKQVANPKSVYAIVRLDVREDVREVNTFRIPRLGTGPQIVVIATTRTLLTGGLWLQLKPVAPLDPGEYALIEVINNHTLNREVWGFGVHADAAANINVIDPQPATPAVKPTLKSRPASDQ